MYEVHVFTAKGSASADNPFGYPAFERHAMLIFSRQSTGTDHDDALAIERAEAEGWFNVELGRAGLIAPESLNTAEQQFKDHYENALEDGSALIVYSEPEN